MAAAVVVLLPPRCCRRRCRSPPAVGSRATLPPHPTPQRRLDWHKPQGGARLRCLRVTSKEERSCRKALQVGLCLGAGGQAGGQAASGGAAAAAAGCACGFLTALQLEWRARTPDLPRAIVRCLMHARPLS